MGERSAASRAAFREARAERWNPAVLLLGSLVAACTSGHDADGALERARRDGIRAGFSIEPPYAFVDSAGEPTGEAPEILRHVLGELEVAEVQWFPLPFHDLIPALLAGRVDVVASGLFVTPERSRQVRFSRPTACVGPVLVVRRDRFEGLVGEGAGKRCEPCRIAVIQASVEERALARQSPSGAGMMAVPDLATAVAAVSEGTADALAISAPTARRIVAGDSALALEARSLPVQVAEDARGCAALAFRPADAELAGAVDSVLAAFVGSPEHLAVVAPFGFTEPELPCPEASPAGPPPRLRSCYADRVPE